MYVIPKPQKWKIGEESFVLSYDKKIVVDISCGMEAFAYAKQIQTEMLQSIGYKLAVIKGKSLKAGIVLSIDPTEERNSEEYSLCVNEKGIKVEGKSLKGLFYGVQSLRQILRQAGAKIPYMEISDYPSMSVRGFYHDVTRGRIPTLDYLKKLADKAAFYKLNQLQLYVEHTYLFEDFSELWRDDTPLTAEDILELDRYCKSLHIDLVPSLSSFGHLYKLLRTKTYCHLCELEGTAKEPFSFIDRMRHHTIDVSNSESLGVITKLMDEYMALFSSKYYNICADETFDLGKGKNQKRTRELGTERVYIAFVRKLCEHVISRGKIPMFWGDIISVHPEYVSELPKETICLNWGYSPEITEDVTVRFAKAGVKQYLCPGVRGWNQLINEIGDSYENIKRMCTYAAKYQALGVLTTDWGDYGNINHPDFSLTGMIYGAAFSWNTEIVDYEEINRQISRVEFMDSSEEFVKIIEAAAKSWEFKWVDAIFYKEKNVWKMTEECMGKLPQAVEKLDTISMQLYTVLPKMSESARSVVKPYLVALQGMRLLQNIGMLLQGDDSDRKAVLASDLEGWFMDYKEIWRSVSREAELFRLQQVVNWYADKLRES